MLEPILGGTGAVVAQYVITLVVILALVALVVWLVRRYAVGGVGTTARGRLPRLAIVDALVVDNRHRLVLVRRDNVEHLVLIGGATDLLIEPSIVRTRLPQRPGQTPQPRPPGQPAAAPAPPPPAPRAQSLPTRVRHQPPGVVEDPIPFPPRSPRTVEPRPSRVAATRLPVRPAEQSAAAPSRETALKRQAVETEMRLPDEEKPPAEPVSRQTARTGNVPPPVEADGPLPFGDLDEPPAPAPEGEPPEVEHPSAFAPPRHRPAAEEEAPLVHEVSATGEETAVPDQPAKTSPSSGPAPKVSDLEKEMARLLGEISTSRSS